MFKQGSPLRRRPSASMLVATLALFVALSGGAYAAVSIPPGSVGSAQLRLGSVRYYDIAAGQVGTRILANNSVTYQKIAPGQIGHVRVAQNQIQWRINGACAGSSAVRSVTDTGNVTCGSTLPRNYATAGLSDPLSSTTAGTVLASESLPAGRAFHITSTPYLEVRGNTPNSTQDVTVTCRLAAGQAQETRSVTFALTGAAEQQIGSIPMSIDLPVGSGTAPTTAVLACVRSYDGIVAPTVQASAGLDALQTQNTVTAVTPGTSTTAFTPTTPTPTTTTTTTTGTTTTPTTTSTTVTTTIP
ncbi:MAG TPA: hypothetical protein VFN48_02835 [Solirubrobacteraceae bacterium]|nr:hypothetical protein [Solirubrobacteraceae bacterium]